MSIFSACFGLLTSVQLAATTCTCQIWISGWILPHFDVRTISVAWKLKKLSNIFWQKIFFLLHPLSKGVAPLWNGVTLFCHVVFLTILSTCARWAPARLCRVTICRWRGWQGSPTLSPPSPPSVNRTRWCWALIGWQYSSLIGPGGAAEGECGPGGQPQGSYLLWQEEEGHGPDHELHGPQ